MKSLFTLIFALLSISVIHAQTYGVDNVPKVGDSIAIKQNNVSMDFTPGPAGQDVTWDFTVTDYPEDEYFIFVTTDDTEKGKEVEGANLAAISKAGAEVYYKYSSSELNQLGLYYEIVGGQFTDVSTTYYETGYEVVDFPIKFGNSSNTTYKGRHVFSNGAFGVKFDGIVSTSVDGQGTLITPAGTFENVFRVKSVISEDNDLQQKTRTEKYYYVSAEYKFWLAFIEKQELPGDENVNRWYNVNPEKITTSNVVYDSDMSIVKLFPNPVETSLQIESKELFERFVIYNIEGAEILSGKLENKGSYNIDISDFDSGVYNIVFSNSNKKITNKFIKK